MTSYKLARIWHALKPTSGWALFIGVFAGGILHPYDHLLWLGIFQLGMMLLAWFFWRTAWWELDDHWHTEEALFAGPAEVVQ